MPKGLSQRAHQKVLETAAELFADRGIDTTSMDAIASKSGVSKATIYKHWADKDALAMEVLVYVHECDAGPPDLDSGDLKADLVSYLAYEPTPRKADLQKRIMPHLIAYSARNHEFGRAWKSRVLERARTGLKKLLRRGMDRGIFSAVLDEELAIPLLLGPMLFSHILGPRLDRKWLAQGAVDSFWKAHARPQPQPRPQPRPRRSASRPPHTPSS
jgi:AcrR family transcriptional regulator